MAQCSAEVLGTEEIVTTQPSHSNNYKKTLPNLYLTTLNMSLFSSTLTALKTDYRETSESEFSVCRTGVICWMWGAPWWCLCLEMTEVFCVILPELGCAPVPPQNRYFRSCREWFCISSILVWLTSSILSPESFHSKFPFLVLIWAWQNPCAVKNISLSCTVWLNSYYFTFASFQWWFL